jgi:phage terminase large subunit GpA-like protein
MSRPLQMQIVEMARAMIEDKHHWCRNHIALAANGVSVYPTNPIAMKRCALGALISAAYELTHDHDAADRLAYDALRPHCGTSTLIYINDMSGHEAVLELFDKVIAMKCPQ